MLIEEVFDHETPDPLITKRCEYLWNLYQHDPVKLKKFRFIFAKHPLYASQYATDVSHEPFPEGEAAIATDPVQAYIYAKTVLQRPFPLAEPLIAQAGPSVAWMYVRDVLKHPWPEAEATIKSDVQAKFWYDKFVDCFHTGKKFSMKKDGS